MKVRTRPLLAVVGLLVSALLPLAAPAAADSGPVPLAMATFDDVVVDDAHGLLFLSGGPTGEGIRVTDLAGGLVSTVALPGASGMALSPDGSDLWVAVPQSGLVRLDAATQAVEHHLALPTGQCAGDVAVVGARVVYGYSCNRYLPGGTGYGGVGVVDATTGALHGTSTSGPSYQPVVEAASDGRVFAADAGVSPTGLHVYDVRGDAPTLQAHVPGVCSNLRDLSAAPLGDRVVTACGGTYLHEVWSLGLDRVGSYSSGPYPVAGAWSGDGSTFAAGLSSPHEPDVHVHRAGLGAAQEAVRQVDFGATTSLLQRGGLAASRDGRRVWAVTSTASDTLALHVIDVPQPGSSVLSLEAEPQALYAGQPTTVTGRLAAVTGAPLAGVPLRVSRAATGAAPTTLEPVVTDGDGRFSFTDTPPSAGSWAYSVTDPSDAAIAETVVLAWATDTRVKTSVWPDGLGVYGTVSLDYDGPEDLTGRTVTVTRTGDGRLLTLPTVTVDRWGNGTFHDSPSSGTWTYTASVAASGVHPAASASSSVTLGPAATTLTMSVSTTATAGTALRLAGTLSAAGAPVTGALVTVRRGSCGTTAWSQEGLTSPDGAWSVTDDAPAVGTCTYSASYGGTPAYAPAEQKASTTVRLRPTTLTVTAPGGLAGSPLRIAGTLSSGTAPLGGATVAVLRSGCTPTSSVGSASTTADGSWSVTDPAPPGGACTYRAVLDGTTTLEGAEASAVSAVAFRAASLSMTLSRGGSKKPTTITGVLGATHSDRTLTITAQPLGGTETTLVSGQVDSTGKLTVTHTPRTTTTYRATFAGDAWYARRTVQAIQ